MNDLPLSDSTSVPNGLVAALRLDDRWYRVEIVNDVPGNVVENSTDDGPAMTSRVTLLANFSRQTLLGWAAFGPTAARDSADDQPGPPPVAVAQVGAEVFTGGLDEPGVAPLRVAGFASSGVAPVFWLRGVAQGSWTAEPVSGEGPAGAEAVWHRAWVDPARAIAQAPEQEQRAVRESFEAAALNLDEQVPLRVALLAGGGLRIEVVADVSADRDVASWSLEIVPAPQVEADIRESLSRQSVSEVVLHVIGAHP